MLACGTGPWLAGRWLAAAQPELCWPQRGALGWLPAVATSPATTPANATPTALIMMICVRLPPVIDRKVCRMGYLKSAICLPFSRAGWSPAGHNECSL
jgi:hypothetical protein